MNVESKRIKHSFIIGIKLYGIRTKKRATRTWGRQCGCLYFANVTVLNFGISNSKKLPILLGFDTYSKPSLPF